MTTLKPSNNLSSVAKSIPFLSLRKKSIPNKKRNTGMLLNEDITVETREQMVPV